MDSLSLSSSLSSSSSSSLSPPPPESGEEYVKKMPRVDEHRGQEESELSVFILDKHKDSRPSLPSPDSQPVPVSIKMPRVQGSSCSMVVQNSSASSPKLSSNTNKRPRSEGPVRSPSQSQNSVAHAAAAARASKASSSKNPLEYFVLVASRTLERDPSKYHPEELGLSKEEQKKKFQPGMALAVARFNDDATLADAQARGWGMSPWAHGPYVYHIDSVFILPNPIPIKGHLGAFRLPSETRDAVVAQIPSGLAGFEGFSIPQDRTASPLVELRGLSLKQPWLYRIMHEGKNIENRKRRIFSTKREPVRSFRKFTAFQSYMKP